MAILGYILCILSLASIQVVRHVDSFREQEAFLAVGVTEVACVTTLLGLILASVGARKNGHYNGFYRGYEVALRDGEESTSVRKSDDLNNYPSEEDYWKKYAQDPCVIGMN